KPAAAKAVKHRVVRGDTVSALAARYGTSVAAVVKVNQLGKGAMIRIGQTLTIPGSGSGSGSSSSASSVSKTVTTTTARHRVVSGDTVSAIAARHSTSVAAIVKANSLDRAATIRIGDVLTIPGAKGSTKASSS